MCRHGRCTHIIKDCYTRCNHNEKKRDDWMNQNRAIFCVLFEWISKDRIKSLNSVQKDWNHILKLKIIYIVLLNLLTGCELFDLLICCLVLKIEIHKNDFPRICSNLRYNYFQVFRPWLKFSNVTVVRELEFRFHWNPHIMLQKISLIFKIYEIKLQKNQGINIS